MNVLLVGRGSSDQAVVEDMKRMARLLEQQMSVNSVQISFLAAAQPSFENQLHQMYKSGCKNVVVVPYLLFTGILMTGIQKTMESLYVGKDYDYTLCHYLGYHPNLLDILKERVLKAMVEEELCCSSG